MAAKAAGVLMSRTDGILKTQGAVFNVVATSPLAQSGHINLSPKGHDTLRIIDQHTVAFLDYGGSGVETIAHLRENQRIVLMFCAFSGPPKIIRLHGNGSVLLPSDGEFQSLQQLFEKVEVGTRAIIKINVTRVSDSCGFGVPLMDYQCQRDTSIKYAKQTGDRAIRQFMLEKNLNSIDGLPGLTKEEVNMYQGAKRP